MSKSDEAAETIVVKNGKKGDDETVGLKAFKPCPEATKVFSFCAPKLKLQMEFNSYSKQLTL